MTAEQDFAIRELLLPGSLDGDEATEFREVSNALDAMALAKWGNLDRASTPRSRLTDWRPTPYFELDAFYARVDGRIAGVGLCRLSLQDNLDTAWIRVEVAEPYRGRGIGGALLEKAQASARARGRHVLQSSTEHPAGFEGRGLDLVVPATGAGGVPRPDPGVAFALRNGYSLEQISRFSTLDLASAKGWDALEAEAALCGLVLNSHSAA
jgi:GNAT superfamily N-acetyltransferase